MNVGTDFTGMDAPLFALDNLKINYCYKFASDINRYARMSVLANHNPEVMYEDVTMPRVLPKLDIYIAGFPCQAFSTAGKMLGEKDPRGNLFMYAYDTIIKTDPNYFILENVMGLVSNPYYTIIKNKLNKLEDYNIHYGIYNTKDYGIPQNRKRLYIVGVKKSIKDYVVPKHIEMVDIESIFTDSTEYHSFPPYILARMETLKYTKIINAAQQHAGSKITNPEICNTITAYNSMWCIKKHRRANITELLRLQGFPDTYIQSVSDSQLKKQIGNAMSVNVVQAILGELLTTK